MRLGKSQREKEVRRVASVAAYNADGLLLFGKRSDSGKWTLPGGHLEPGEEPMDGARRELEEEAGLKGQDFEFLGRGLGGPKGDIIVYSYRCVVEGDPDGAEDPDEECEEWRWCEPDDIPEAVSANLHSPKNVTLRLLGLQDGEVEEPMAKADPNFVERNPYRGNALRIPKYGTKSRKKWDADYLQAIAHLFAGGDVSRLRPVQVPTDTVTGVNMPANKSRLALYKRMLAAKDRLPPVVVKKMGSGYHLLDGNHRQAAAQHAKLSLLNAVEVVDPPLRKGLPALGLAAALSMGGATRQPPQQKPVAAFEVAQELGTPTWHPEGLHPDLYPIAHLESSWGQNVAHASNKKGEFHTAFGALGFKPVTAHEEYQKSKYMQNKYPDLNAPEKFLQTFKQDSKFYNLLASAHFTRLKHRHGGAQQAAFAWRWGTGATANATPEQIQNDAYVQKYTHMNLDQKTGQPLMKDPLVKADLEKVSLTPERVANRMTPHQVHGTEAFDRVESYSLGNGLWHHVYYEEANPGATWSKVHHSLSSNENPLVPGHATAAAGVVPSNYTDWYGAGFNNNPWNDSKPAIVHGETASRGPKGSGTLLYRNMLKIHGRMISDSGVSAGANGVWAKIHADPEFAGGTGHNEGDRHWAEYKGARPVPTKVIEGDGRPLQAQVEAPANPYRPEVRKFPDKGGYGYVEARVHHGDRQVSVQGLYLDHQKKTLHTAAPYYSYQGLLGTHADFDHRDKGAVGVGLKAAERETGYRYAGDTPQEMAESIVGKPGLAKTEQHDPLDAMLAHDDPRERIMALRSKHVTPYHLRRALRDEDPDVRAAAAKHPMMTSSLVEEALRDGDLHTKQAALSRPDLQEHHLEIALWDPDLQTQAALHPALTEEQRQKLVGAQDTPEGLRTHLLAKSAGYLLYPNLDQARPASEPMIRTPEGHKRFGEAVAPKHGKYGFVNENSYRNKPLPPEKRFLRASVAMRPTSSMGNFHHETQHSVFSALRQKYGREPVHRIVAHTLLALDPDDHRHLRNITDWAVQNRYDPTREPEERLAYLQNYLQDGLWRKSAHKHMRIHMDRNAEKISHDWAKRIWQKLRIRAESLKPSDVGVTIRKDEETIESWLIKQSDDVSYNVYEDMLGLTPKTDAYLEAAKFLAHTEPDVQAFRSALLRDEPLQDAALISVGLPVDDENRRALAAVLKLQSSDLSKADATHEVQAMMPDGAEVAEGVRRGFGASTEQQLHLGGKHSAGTLLVKDPETGQMYLLKPGTNKQSPALGARQDPTNQSRREAAFWHVAEAWGLNQRLPRADLLLIDGKEVAALHMLPFEWKNLEKLKFKDPSLPQKALEKYRQMGELHKWAVLDFVLGNPDRHGQNLMVGPQADGYPVALIDHGSAFAGDAFDPANDKNSFIPYYLRVWRAESWAKLTPAERLRAMPTVSGDTERQLREWFHGLHVEDLEALLHRYGIDPGPEVQRFARVKALLAEDNFSEAINQLWLAT